MSNGRLDEAKTRIKIARRNIKNLRYADDTILIRRKLRGTKEPLDESERGEWKSWLKTQHSKNTDHGIWSHHCMANRWGNFGNSDKLYFLGFQNHCGWWLQPWNWKTLAPWKKSYNKSRQCIKKQRHYYSNKGLSSQSYGFSSCHVWIWELTIQKVEHWRIDAFELWCCRRLLRILWTARRSNQSILKEINPEYSLEGLMLKLKHNTLATWCKSQLIRKDPEAGKGWRTEEKGKTEDKVGWHHCLSGHESENSGRRTGKPGVLQSMGSQESDMTEQLNNSNNDRARGLTEQVASPEYRMESARV